MTDQAQLVVKWAFVAKRKADCGPDDPADDCGGDHWYQVTLDPDHRPVVSVVTGKRTAEDTGALARDFPRRTSG